MKKVLFILFAFSNTLLFANIAVVVPDTNENGINYDETLSFEVFFKKTDTFLGKYIRNGNVDYTAIKAEYNSLKELVAFIANADINSKDQDTKTAFYLNAYNLLVIKSVVDNLPLKSPLDVSGFFDSKKHAVAGSYLTLNDLENKKLRSDARVHFVLVCAAKGCPKIISEAYLPETMQIQLETQTIKAINNDTFIKVDHETKTVEISQIFDWYKDDFISSSGSVINYINKYRINEIPTSYTISYSTYDWNLNGK